LLNEVLLTCDETLKLDPLAFAEAVLSLLHVFFISLRRQPMSSKLAGKQTRTASSETRKFELF
jgi:hypothetical protein